MTQVQELVEAALAASTADGCVVVAEDHTETNLRWAANSLTTNGQMHHRSVTVIATFDGADGTRAGVVTRSVSTAEEIDGLVRAAERAGRDASPADDAMPLVENYDHADDWAADPVGTDVSVFAQFARDLGAEFDRWRLHTKAKSDRALYGFAEHQVTSTYLGTSTGLRRRFDQPDGRVELNGKVADGASTRSAYVSRHTTRFADVDARELTGELERRLDWAAERIDLPAGRYETILPPSTVADLMIYAYWSAAARDAEQGRSVFSAGAGATRIGDRLAPLPLRLHSDPAYPGLECAPFQVVTGSSSGLTSVFDNGAPNPPVDWIRGGVLTDLVRPRGWAARSDAEPRHVVDNLVLDAAGTTGVEEMVAATGRGLLLTCMWYIREVDPQTLLLTGLTRDGVYLVEDGAVRGAVNNFRFNESPIDLLRRASEVGRTEETMSREWCDYFRRTAMPALRIPDFNMSTVSRAS